MMHPHAKPTWKLMIQTALLILVLLAGSLVASLRTSALAPAWQPGVFYATGALASYNGVDYKATQGHTSQVGWEPPNVPALWTAQAGGTTTVPATATRTRTSTTGSAATATRTRTRTSTTGAGATATRTRTRTSTTGSAATATRTATTGGGVGCWAAWVSTTAYGGGSQVSRNGQNYQAAFWSQGSDPATSSGPAGSGQPWVQMGACGGTTASATPTRPAASPTRTATPGGPTPTTPPSGPRRYVAYASSWNTSIYDLTPANIPSYITNINLAFVRPDTNYVRGSYAFDQEVAGFEFVEGASTPNGQKRFTAQQAQDLRNNIAALKARGTQVWISVGGWSYSQGSAWTRLNAGAVVALALDLGATGIDIDWEASGSSCNKQPAATFNCTGDAEIAGIVTNLYNARQGLQLSVAGWSTGAYYVAGTPFEEGKVQWGSPFGGTMYNVVKNHGSKLTYVNLMSYDGGEYYDPREGYLAYRAIYGGIINVGIEIAPEGAGGATLELNAPAGTSYDAEILTGQNNIASQYYNVETIVNYVKNRARPTDGMMIWQLWKERVHMPAPSGSASVNQAGQYICRNLPLAGNCNDAVPNLPKLTP